MNQLKNAINTLKMIIDIKSWCNRETNNCLIASVEIVEIMASFTQKFSWKTHRLFQ
jgi:hypothetical protein